MILFCSDSLQFICIAQRQKQLHVDRQREGAVACRGRVCVRECACVRTCLHACIESDVTSQQTRNAPNRMS